MFDAVFIPRIKEVPRLLAVLAGFTAAFVTPEAAERAAPPSTALAAPPRIAALPAMRATAPIIRGIIVFLLYFLGF
jgi:uncharacterized membrane protein